MTRFTVRAEKPVDVQFETARVLVDGLSAGLVTMSPEAMALFRLQLGADCKPDCVACALNRAAIHSKSH